MKFVSAWARPSLLSKQNDTVLYSVLFLFFLKEGGGGITIVITFASQMIFSFFAGCC